ncbi:hypothetical protein O4220_06330 [Rhodococcus ruber]|uniref:Uncharacterized protein n=1 Tax=Rhodococcus ruber TaxID=1830 RepID=A0ABT4MAX7_9NOCA|nr:hypothetical protein [Rhodococcus ruber]MCZ4518129.1 hypothetical protein [Rhodococcus ruber]
MTDTPIHDALQKFLELDTGGGDRHAEAKAKASPAKVPVRAPSRHRRA